VGKLVYALAQGSAENGGDPIAQATIRFIEDRAIMFLRVCPFFLGKVEERKVYVRTPFKFGSADAEQSPVINIRADA
jgi:hypothetical protein